VTKRLFTFGSAVDQGLAAWAASYLNERLVGLGLGARMLRQRITDPELSARERGFIDDVSPAFTQLADTADDSVYFDGAAHLLRGGVDVSELEELMELLERRVSLLGVLREALGHRDVFVRIGAENEAPALRSLAVVAASYGLPQRSLGTVSVIGPVRMDYAGTMRAVQSVAAELSRFVEDVYDE
jgi:heat-inducible transcriptional repressor